MWLVLVAYDVSTQTLEGKNRLRRIAKICENHGQRVQNSLFECFVSSAIWAKLSKQLLSIMDCEADSLRFYFLGGGNWRNKIEHHGIKIAYDPEGLLCL